MDPMNFSILCMNYALVMLNVVIAKAFLKTIQQEDRLATVPVPIVGNGTKS